MKYSFMFTALHPLKPGGQQNNTRMFFLISTTKLIELSKKPQLLPHIKNHGCINKLYLALCLIRPKVNQYVKYFIPNYIIDEVKVTKVLQFTKQYVYV